jgi:Na+-driven multidrug efflux pump
MGTVRNVWILAEEKQHFLWKINLAGVVANIVLNAMLIPVWNACGAALASLFTQAFTNFVLGFVYPPLRENNRLLLKGMNPMLLWNLISKYRERRTEGTEGGM